MQVLLLCGPAFIYLFEDQGSVIDCSIYDAFLGEARFVGLHLYQFPRTQNRRRKKNRMLPPFIHRSTPQYGFQRRQRRKSNSTASSPTVPQKV